MPQNRRGYQSSRKTMADAVNALVGTDAYWPQVIGVTILCLVSEATNRESGQLARDVSKS